MNTQRCTVVIIFLFISLFVVGLSLSGCGAGSGSTPTPQPTFTPEPTSMEDFAIKDFGLVHSPVNGDANEHLIFGNIPIASPAADLPAELAAFLGRWEGYSDGPPVKKDYKFVLVVQEITPRGGKAFGWAGTNLQYPNWIKEIKFRVVPGATPAIEGEYDLDGKNSFTFTYDRDKDLLQGWLKSAVYNSAPWGPIELTRNKTFFVYKDYAQYLAGKRITSQTYRTSALQKYGQGYLLYLPEGYETQAEKTWPLIFFLHGSGDRGDNLLLLAKASPFMMIREKGPLPFIIVAPLLNASQNEFPLECLDGVLAEAQATYRVDPKRIYVTGLSLGGKATYRFATQHPDTFAAIAPLSAYADSETLSLIGRIKDLPVWAIHGANDVVVPLSAAQHTVDDLKQAGVNVRFTILENHDHDVWTDTYSDPKFYDWLLQHQRP